MTANVRVRVGQFSQAVRQSAYIIIALALPRLGVPTAQIGEWESLLFLGYVLGFGWTTGLLQGFLVQFGKLEIHDTGSLFSRRAVQTTLLLSAIVLTLAALFYSQLFAFLQMSGAPVGWYFFFVLLLSRWPSYCFEQSLLVMGRLKFLFVYALINATGITLSLLLPLYLGQDLAQAMQFLGAYAGAKSLLIVLWTLVRPDKDPTQTETPFLPQTKDWLRTSRPLMAYASIAALVSAVDPWIVNYWSGGDEQVFAIFRYGVREVPFLAALIAGMTVVALPAITRDGSDGLQLLKSQSRKLFHYVFGLTLLMMLTGDYWWTKVFTPSFAESLPIFRTFLLVVGCRLVFAMTVLTAFDYTKRLYLWGLLELGLNVIISLALAPKYGLQGILWGTVIASYFHEICLVVYLWYKTGIVWRTYADLPVYFCYLTALFLAYYFII